MIKIIIDQLVGKDEITEEIIKRGWDRVVVGFGGCVVVPEDWRSAVTVQLYKGKGEI